MLINYISNNPSILYLFLVAFAFWPKVKPHPIDRRSGCSWSLQMRWWLVGIAFIGVSDACLVIFQPMEVTNYELIVPFFRFFSGYFRICSTSKWWSVSIPNLTGNLTQKDIIVSIKRVKRLIFPMVFPTKRSTDFPCPVRTKDGQRMFRRSDTLRLRSDQAMSGGPRDLLAEVQKPIET